MTSELDTDADYEEWSTPCKKCGSRRVASTEINVDDPDADVHEVFFCRDCDEDR